MAHASRLSAIVLSLGFVLLGTATPALSQSVEDEAGMMLYEAGKKAFDRRRYQQASEKFEKALAVAFGGDVDRAHKGLLNMLGRSYAQLV